MDCNSQLCREAIEKTLKILTTEGDMWSRGTFEILEVLRSAHHNQMQKLIIMDNNRSYLNSENQAAAVARFRSRPEERKGVGITLTDPPVDFCQMARSFGLHAEGPIANPADIKPVLKRAVQEVKKGKAVLVDVVTSKGQ